MRGKAEGMGATENRHVFICHRQEKLRSHVAVLTGNAIAITPILYSSGGNAIAITPILYSSGNASLCRSIDI